MCNSFYIPKYKHCSPFSLFLLIDLSITVLSVKCLLLFVVSTTVMMIKMGATTASSSSPAAAPSTIMATAAPAEDDPAQRSHVPP